MLHFLEKFLAACRRRRPLIQNQVRKPQEVVRVRSGRVQSDCFLQLAHRVVHKICIAVGPGKEHAQRPAVSRGLHHLPEDGIRLFLLLGGNQGDSQRIGCFQVRVNLDRMRKRFRRFLWILLLHPRLALNVPGAGTLGIASEHLRGLRKGLIQSIHVKLGDGEIHARIRKVFEIHRMPIQFDSLGIGRLLQPQLPHLAEAKGDQHPVCLCNRLGIAGTLCVESSLPPFLQLEERRRGGSGLFPCRL